MLDFIREGSIWQRLRKDGRPIVLYGMGDGALKILARCRDYGVQVAEIFASDEFVRGHSFAGFQVKRLSELEEQYEDFIILLSFAVFTPELLGRIRRIASRHILLAPDVPVFGDGTFNEIFCDHHEAELQAAYDLLEDDWSKKVFADVINFKLSGKIGYLFRCETPRLEVFERILFLYENEDYLDLGAYDGDTIHEFLSLTGRKYQSITAVEPDPKNFLKLTASCGNMPETRLLQAGIWDSDRTLTFDGRAGRNSSLSARGNLQVPVRSIDSIVFGEENPRCSYIKMDVEGAELQALMGARQTLWELRPKLAFSGYHRNEDLFALPLKLKELCPEYRIYLRHHPYLPAWETNFYAAGQ